MIDASIDDLSLMDTRDIGTGFVDEPVFLNSSETSLYAGQTRFDPDNLDAVLGVYPEFIYAATGDDSLAFGANGIYDPLQGTKLANMPVGYEMMVLGQGERYLYTFDSATRRLHVMSVVPEPGTAVILLASGLLVCSRNRRRTRPGAAT